MNTETRQEVWQRHVDIAMAEGLKNQKLEWIPTNTKTGRDAKMERCNKESNWYSSINGFRVCADCVERYYMADFNILIHDGPESLGPCDRPIDNKGAMPYWQRVKSLADY